MRYTRIVLAPAATLALILAGCSSPADKPAPAASTSGVTASASPAETGIQGKGLEFKEMWVKAADGKMTAAFGFLHNTTDKDIHVTGVSSKVAGKCELHETVAKDGKMMMQQMSDGFIIKAGETKELMPGGDHLMLMQLPKPIEPGQEVVIELAADGGKQMFSFKATARTFAGAKEEYGVHGEDKKSGGHEGHDGAGDKGEHKGHDGHDGK